MNILNKFKKYLLIFFMLCICSCSTKIEYVYVTQYPELPQIKSPLILPLNKCEFILPEDETSNIFVGYDKQNYKCYIKNQEINREQKLLYEKLIEELNKERKKFIEMNKKSIDK